MFKIKNQEFIIYQLFTTTCPQSFKKTLFYSDFCHLDSLLLLLILKTIIYSPALLFYNDSSS